MFLSQVMSDAAVACVTDTLSHCQAACLLPRILEAARSDRSPKLRAACFAWVATILDTWADSAGIDRSASAVEETLRCGIADGDADVRSKCKAAAAAVAKRWPEAYARFFATMDASNQRRLPPVQRR